MTEHPYNRYLRLQTEKKKIAAEIEACQIDLYNLHKAKFDSKEKGAVNVEEGGWKLTVTKKINYTIDQKKTAVLTNSDAFKVKYELNQKAYDSLSIENKAIADEAITTKTGKPSFKLEYKDA